jgi:3-oxoacyl-[acyl-carrier protein] reductase
MKKMRHALVTGASRGIGFEITKKLLLNSIAVTGTARESKFPETLHMNEYFKGVYADLGDGAALRVNIKPLFENNCPDVLINNAGISVDADFSLSDEEWLETWNRTLHVNLRSAALLCKWFVNSHLDSGTEGIIINIASRAAYRGDTQEYGAYAASKGGMVAFTKSMARDFSRKGIFCYSIAPGFVQTDMAEEGVRVYGEEYLTQGSAFDEITQPGEVANMVAFIAKGEVKHMSGSTFHINGGSYMI